MLGQEKTLPALHTLVRSVARVTAPVLAQVAGVVEAAVTVRTGEGFFPCVSPHVFGQIAGLSVAGATLLAAVRFLAGVCSHVDFQVRDADETFGADIALVRPLARVNAQVFLKHILP